MTDGRLYLAYGSNLHPTRLRERVPSAALHGPAVLVGHVLRFHKRGRDRSGKCDAYATGRTADVVHGALYRLAPADVETLHDIEGVGRGYDLHAVRVRAGNATLDAFTYRANAAWIDDALAPWDWYKTLVVAGARRHGFPEDYVRAIDAVASVADPDAARAAAHAGLLARVLAG